MVKKRVLFNLKLLGALCCFMFLFAYMGLNQSVIRASANVIDSGESRYEDVSWTLDSNGTLTIKGDGKVLKGEGWDVDKKYIKKIVVKEGITEIGSTAFYYYTELKSVTLPKGVETIENGAFAGCTKLKKIKMSSGLLKIERTAFQGCLKLKKLTIPSSVKEVGDYIVKGCKSLKDINIKCSDVDSNFSYHAFQQDDGYLGTIYLHGDISVMRYVDSLHSRGFQKYLEYK